MPRCVKQDCGQERVPGSNFCPPHKCQLCPRAGRSSSIDYGYTVVYCPDHGCVKRVKAPWAQGHALGKGDMNCPNAKSNEKGLYCKEHECVSCGAERRIEDACGLCCKFEKHMMNELMYKLGSLICSFLVYRWFIRRGRILWSSWTSSTWDVIATIR